MHVSEILFSIVKKNGLPVYVFFGWVSRKKNSFLPVILKLLYVFTGVNIVIFVKLDVFSTLSGQIVVLFYIKTADMRDTFWHIPHNFKITASKHIFPPPPTREILLKSVRGTTYFCFIAVECITCSCFYWVSKMYSSLTRSNTNLKIFVIYCWAQERVILYL